MTSRQMQKYTVRHNTQNQKTQFIRHDIFVQYPPMKNQKSVLQSCFIRINQLIGLVNPMFGCHRIWQCSSELIVVHDCRAIFCFE